MFRRMSDAKVGLVYRGEAVEGGLMDVRELAPALFAFGDACQEANRLLNGKDAELTVKVKSDFKTGSFEIQLEVAQKFMSAVLDFATGKSHLSATEILEILGFFGINVPGVIQLWQWLKRETPRSVTQVGNNNVLIEKADRSTITVNNNVVIAANNSLIRKYLPEVFAPLTKPGFTEAVIQREDKTVTARVTSKEAPALHEPPSLTGEPVDEVLNDTTGEAVLEVIRPVVRPSYQERYIWTLTDGKHPYSVHIEDRDFLERVDRGEISFTSHDLLRVELNTRQLRTPEGKLRSEQRVLRVKEVIHAPARATQLDLLSVVPPSSGEGDDDDKT
jgi:hypothetical protein